MSQDKTYEARETDSDPCDLCCFWRNPCMDPDLKKDFSEVAKAMHQTDRACGTQSRVYFVEKRYCPRCGAECGNGGLECLVCGMSLKQEDAD